MHSLIKPPRVTVTVTCAPGFTVAADLERESVVPAGLKGPSIWQRMHMG